MRKCKTCGERYEPTRSIQTACGLPCAIIQATQKRLAADAKAHRAAKLRLKSRAQWMKEAQAAFNRFIRARDAGRPCISCGRMHDGQIHAGHYLSTGARPELRFDEQNCHAQCAPCNTHLSGNLVQYRAGLIERIGIEAVESLEGPHEPMKYTIAELTEIKARSGRLVRKLTSELA